MKMRQFPIIAGLVALIAIPVGALDIGDAAPDLKIGTIVKGEEVKTSLNDLGEVYVVEFWATWCGPCRQSVPHLSELQAKYKDKGVRIIGISDESEDTVKGFVETMGEKMDYTVVSDESGATWERYAEPFGVTGIPHAFVVDQTGTLVWHGHPMDGLDEVVAKVAEGSYDIGDAKEKAKMDQAREELSELTMLWAQEYLVRARFGRDNAAADAVGKQILECGYDDATFYGQVAWTLLSNQSLAYKNNEFAMSVAMRANELAEGKSADVLDTLALGYFTVGKKDEAIATQKKAIALCTNDELMVQLKERLAKYEAS